MKWTKGNEYSRRIDLSTLWTKVKCFFGKHVPRIKNLSIYRTTYHCKFCYCDLGRNVDETKVE